MTPADHQMIAYQMNANLQAFVLLAKCLTKTGALLPGQFASALRATFNEPVADFERLDYQILRRLAQSLDEAMPSG